MTFERHRFGSRDILLFGDGLFEAPASVISHADGEQAREAAIAAFGAPRLSIDCHLFAIPGEAGVTLIDAGGGPAMGPGFGKARAAMAREGITPEAVRRVLVTHIHSDHALGLLDGEGAYFPTAEILIPAAEFAYFTDPAAKAALPEARRGPFGIMERVRAAYDGRIQIVPEAAVSAGFDLVPLPGHTPGHAGYRLTENGRTLMILGDVLHLGALQAADPALGLVYDLDQAVAVRTRRQVLEDAAAGGWLVAGGHIGFSTVARNGTGYRLAAA